MRKLYLSSLLACLFFMQIDTASAQNKPVFSIPFTLIDNRPYIEVKIKHQTLHLILDCGADFSLNLSVAKRLGLKLTDQTMQGGAGAKNVPFWNALVDTCHIGAAVVVKKTFMVTDLSQIINGLHLPYLDGATGYGFMKDYAVQFDYPHHVINFYKSYTGVAPVPFTLYYGSIPKAKIKIDGKDATVIMDTGDRTPLTIFKHYAIDKGLLKSYQLSDTAITGYGIGGPIYARWMTLKQLTIGKLTLPNVHSRIPMLKTGMFAATDIDGSVGGGVFKQYKFTIDYLKQRLYFE